MSLGEKIIYGAVFIEVQIILILLIFMTTKVLDVEEKVERTNQFLYTAIQDKNIAALESIDANDIVIGDENAPATMYLYTRFNCPACSEFYDTSYEKLVENFVDKGLLKIVVRYLTHIDNKDAFFAAKCAQYAHINNVFPDYNKSMISNYSNLNIPIITETILSILPDSTKLSDYLNKEQFSNIIFDKAKAARAAGVSRTPTIIINKQLLVGNRRFEKLAALIQEELNS